MQEEPEADLLWSPAEEFGDVDMARSTVAMTGMTAVSRVTGFVRVLVVAAVLGTTFLGNTYQSANTVPNILFELLAAGALQAVLIPGLVAVLDAGSIGEADRVAGTVFGVAAGALAILSAIGLALAPFVMRAVFSGVHDAATRHAQVRLGVFFLWFFLPQTVVYAAGLVATAAMNARNRFLLPVAAPIVNNVVVIASYAAFAWLRHGAAPSLDLTLTEKLVLAGGTTAGVIALCTLPVIGARRLGFSMRPRLELGHPVVRRLLRQGAWAAVYLALTQVLLAAVLVLANRIAGGVIAYQLAFTVFLLPHALFAVPALTALYPRLSRQAIAADREGFAESIRRGLDAIAFFTLAATAALMALAGPLSHLLLYGASAGSTTEVTGALRGFAPGMVGYGAFLFLTRALYALHDARTPALANGVLVLVGAVAMVTGFAVLAHPGVATLAAVHSSVYLLGALALFVVLVRRRHAHAGAVGRLFLSHGVGAAAAGVVMALVAAAVSRPGRVGALIVTVAAGAAGLAVLLMVRAVVRPRGARLLPELVAPSRD